jgi:hypothetical protein
MRRKGIFAAVAAAAVALGVSPTAAWADRLDLVPAPPASASAVAAQVGSLLDVSQTGATAGGDGSAAQASVVDLLGHPLLGLGGSQQGDGQSNGSLLDTGSSVPARVEVAPWSATADSHGGVTHGHGSAAAARVDAPHVATAGVLTSESDATHTDMKSTGTAASDGFQASILDGIGLVLLHSEVSSEGQGHSYLVGLNGTEIGTDQQLGGSLLCSLNAGLLSLSCLSSSGGAGAVGGLTDAASQVVQVTPALDALAPITPVAGFTAEAASGTGQSTPVAEPVTAPAVDTSRAIAPAVGAATEAGSTTGKLPRTGTAAGSLAAAAAGLAALGLALRRFRVRPATH